MNASQIATLINEIYDGVERSKVGPIIAEKEGRKEINHVPFQTYLSILTSLFPKFVSGEVTTRERP